MEEVRFGDEQNQSSATLDITNRVVRSAICDSFSQIIREVWELREKLL